jgi:branched-chain amino acid transport system permease protein
MLQYLADGLVLGATIGLGAVGLTLTYGILRFANFAHGELVTWGAYLALAILWAMAGLAGVDLGSAAGRIGPLGFGWPLIVALLIAMIATGGLAWLLDRLLFARLRRHGTSIVLVIASFGAALALRNLITLTFGPTPDYFSRAIQIALPLVPRHVLGGVRLTADQLCVILLAAVAVVLLHLFLSRTTLGRSMRAVAENPTLAEVVGIEVQRVVRWTWLIGGGLAALSGVFLGITGQLRPQMGFDLLLPLFAAAILGGIGSPYGAALGGLIVGMAESLAVPLVGAEYRAAVAFLVLILVLLARPQGLLGERGDR